MKHLIVKRDPVDGTNLHELVGYSAQDFRKIIHRYHEKGEDLICITDAQIAGFSGINVFARKEKMFLYDPSVPTLVLVDNPDWDPTGGLSE